MEMQQKGVNMQDLRNELGVTTIRTKIEKRVMERIGHVIRMEDTRMTKAVCLCWMEELAEGPRKEKENCSLLEKVGERSWF